MDSFIYSINATVPIFLVMIVGWGIKQLGVIDEHFVSKANKYVFHVALPVLLFQQISSADMTSQFDIRFVLYCMLATTAFFGIMGGDGTVDEGRYAEGKFCAVCLPEQCGNSWHGIYSEYVLINRHGTVDDCISRSVI